MPTGSGLGGRVPSLMKPPREEWVVSLYTAIVDLERMKRKMLQAQENLDFFFFKETWLAKLAKSPKLCLRKLNIPSIFFALLSLYLEDPKFQQGQPQCVASPHSPTFANDLNLQNQ